MKRELTKRELVLFGLPVLGLLVGMIGYFLLVAPEKSRASRLASQVDAAQAALLAAHQKPPKQVHISAHAVELFRLTTAMPDSSDVPGLLRNLSRLAAASKVTIQSVSPQNPIPLTLGYGALPVNLTIAGTFTTVSDFLRRIRTQAMMRNGKVHATGRLLIAKSVSLSPGGTGNGLTVALSLDAYVYGIAPPPAPAATTTTTTSG